MQAEEILTKARTDTGRPEGWIVFPLLRSKVAQGLAGWVLGIIMGVGLLALIVPVVIPDNFEHGLFAIIFTCILLAILIFVAIGSLVLLLGDLQRLRKADSHVIVITGEDFVKQEGDKIIHVPLVDVRHVTARGRPPVDRTPPQANRSSVRDVPGIGASLLGPFLGRRPSAAAGAQPRRKRMRTPTSLAFIDARSETEVTVVNDGSYGDPFAIARVLQEYAAATQ